MSVKVPGASVASGKRIFPTYTPGKYGFICDSAEEKETRKGDGIQLVLGLKIVEAPEQSDGRDVQGKGYQHRIWIPKDIHPRFDELGPMAANRVKECAVAFGVRIKTDDEVDPQAFVGKPAVASMRIKEGKDADGAPRPENEIVKWYPAGAGEPAKAKGKKGRGK